MCLVVFAYNFTHGEPGQVQRKSIIIKYCHPSQKMQTRYNTYFIVIVCDIYILQNEIQVLFAHSHIVFIIKVRMHLNAFNLESMDIHGISIFPR